MDISYTRVTATGFGKCLTSFPNLSSFSANGLQLSSEVNILSSPQYSLSSLSLAWNSALTDTFLIGIAPLLPNLRALVLSHCPLITDISLKHICGRCDLNQLYVRGCKGISQKGMRDSAEGKNILIIR